MTGRREGRVRPDPTRPSTESVPEDVMGHGGSLEPSLLRLVRPLSLRPHCETWACTLQGRPLVVRRYAPRRPGSPWPPPPDVEGIAPPHRRVERLLAWRTDPDGVTWHLFRLVPGRSLREALSEGPWTPDRWMPLLLDLAEGLAWLHEGSPAAPRLHGDLSPANLVVTPRGRGVLVDLRGDRPRGPGSDRPGPIGTIPYLASEVLEGDPATPASEVMSMGWLTCRVLGWFRPPDTVSPREVARTRQMVLPAVLAGDKGLVSLVEALLDPNPQRRPTAREVHREVRRLLRSAAPEAR